MERGCAGVGSGWAGAYRGCLRQWENWLKTGALRSRIRVFLRGKTVELDVRPSGAASANDRKEAGRRRLTLLSILVVQQTLTATIGQFLPLTHLLWPPSGRRVRFPVTDVHPASPIRCLTGYCVRSRLMGFRRH